MKYLIVLQILLFLVLLCTLTPSYAYRIWEPENGIPLRQGYHIEFKGSSAMDEDGNICVLWTEARDGFGAIYAQLYDSDGNPQWDEGGVPVAENTYLAFPPDITGSGDGYWIIAWIDQTKNEDNVSLYYPDYNGNTYMQKLDENGDPQWVDNNYPDLPGVLMTDSVERRGRIMCFADEDGGAVAVWADQRNGSTDIFAQRIDSEGNFPDGWDDGNIMVAGGAEHQGYMESGYSAVPDGEGGVIVTWQDTRDPTDQDLYANRIDFNGNLVWDDDPEEGLPICLFESEQEQIEICPDGRGGTFFVWVDSRDDPYGDLYCQYVDQEGNIHWDEEGELICDSRATQTHPAIVNVDLGEAVIVWEDHRSDWNSSDLYMQKISGVDSIIIHWQNNGLLLTNDFRSQSYPRLAADGEGGVVVVWYDERIDEYPEGDIYAQRIDQDGRRIWFNGHDVIVTNKRSYWYSHSVHVNDGTSSISWNDTREGSSAVYWQKLDIETGDTLLIEDGEEIASGTGGQALNPKISIDGENLWFAWEDNRWGNMGRYIYAQKADISDGNLTFETNGIPVRVEEPDRRYGNYGVQMDSVAIAPDGIGGLLVAWHDNTGTYYKNVNTQRINEYGVLLWDEDGNSPTSRGNNVERQRDKTRPRILPTDDGGMYVAFHKYVGNSWYQQILLQKMSPEGEPEWTEEDHNAVMVTQGDYDHTIEGLKYFEDGSVLVVFSRPSSPNYHPDIFAQRIDSDGMLQWDKNVSICDAEGVQNRSKIANVNDGVLVVWEDRRNDENSSDIYGQVIFSDSHTRWQNNGIALVEEESSQRQIALGVRSDNEWSFWLSWTEYDESRNPDLYAQRFDWQGLPMLEPGSGIPVCVTETYQSDPRIVVGSEQDAYIIWEDEVDNYIIDLHYTHLDADGNPMADQYDGDGMTLSNARHIQQDAVIARDGDGGFIAVWEDMRTTIEFFRYDIYAQRVNDGLVGVRENNVSSLLDKWSLEAVYPNPFNSYLNIKVALPLDSKLQIKLYNILGKEVAVLADDFYRAGSRRFAWNTGNLASGIYFVQAEVPGKLKAIRKVSLIK
ncbi:MAG: T9SS type A sorting domain-containing protein [Candidatus Electryonea clarkiae]|nr:T9SS type A sorting domain-containing protein [Candidatus Electryonea clarkiae]MDP8286378.1 T9SS type A sorting domain-containing protein [Candidatus Electryonea clarkiae]